MEKKSNHMSIEELEKKEKEIIKRATEAGVEDEYLFITTFERYRTQIRMCIDLKEAYDEQDTMVEKEYIKGRINIVVNPVINAFNQTTSGANKTAEALLKIIKASVEAKTARKKKDPLADALQG